MSSIRKIKRIPFLFKRFIIHVKDQGLRHALARVRRYIRNGPRYKRWFSTPLYTEEQLELQRADKFDTDIVISILTPLYNTNVRYLKQMLDSVKTQTYANWELCLVDGSDDEHDYVGKMCQEYSSDDARIKYRKLETNTGIIGNSNECIKLATGEYIALLDHDDILHPAALHDVMRVICDKDADFIYTDEMTFAGNNTKKVVNIHFKPDYAPDNLRANNYICHLTVFKRTLLEDGVLFREGYEGSQDHDLVLRLTRRAENIVHIPEVLYYWRSAKGSTAESADNKPYCSVSGQKAVSDSLKEQGIDAVVETAFGLPTVYRVRYALKEPLPKISIIIPTRDHVDVLRRCIDSIKEKSSYSNYELIIVDNDSSEPDSVEYLSKLEHDSDNVKVVRVSASFNWSVSNNRGVAASDGDYYLFLNNDTEVIAPQWLEEMLMHAQRPDVGIAGAMLYYPEVNLIQHAGVILGMGGVASHAFKGLLRDSHGYMGRLRYAQNYSAVTGACMMVRKNVYDAIGGFDEEITTCYGDIDFCLKARKLGYLVVWTPYSELYHYESRSLGRAVTPKNKAVWEIESKVFINRWKEVLESGDPYYNPNLSLRVNDFGVKSTQGVNVKEFEYEPDRRSVQ